MNDVETLLSSDDLGRDLSSVKFLLKKQHGIEADAEVHATQIQELCDQAQTLIEGSHFDSGSIEQAANRALDRLVCSGGAPYMKKKDSVFLFLHCLSLR